MAAAATALAAAVDGSVVDGCIRAGGSVDAKDDGAVTAESEGTVDGMAAAATALAAAADGSVVDDARANGTSAEAKADDAAEAEGGGSGAWGAGDAKGDGN
jgi:hypothetical protein